MLKHIERMRVMRYWHKHVAMIVVILLVFSPFTAFGNAGPITVEEEPAFHVMPNHETVLAVESEQLMIDLSQGGVFTAWVQAVYQMVNDSNDAFTQTMVFPFVTAPSRSYLDTVQVHVDGVPIELRQFRLLPVDGPDAAVDPEERFHVYMDQIQSIDLPVALEMINTMHDNKNTQLLHERLMVYQFEIPVKEEAYQLHISFSIDAENQMVIADGFNSYGFAQPGVVTLGKRVHGEQKPSQFIAASAAVLGGSLEEALFIEATNPVNVTREEMTMEEFVFTYGSLVEEINDEAEKTALLHYVVNQMAKKKDAGQAVSMLGDSVSQFQHGTYMGALMFDVDFHPGQKREMSIGYDLRTSEDRSITTRYSALVGYLLSPATYWNRFENLSIEVVPHADQPYVLTSTLDLTRNPETGIYHGFFPTLPSENLVFRMYHRSEPESGLAKRLSNPYILLLIIPAMLLLSFLIVAVVLVVFMVKKRKKEGMHRVVP